MAFTTASLPNQGRTAHFAVSYEDTLAQADGLDRASELLTHCESDLALICSWFPGVSFLFDFPIEVQITGLTGGATWADPADITRWFGFNPPVTIMPGANPTTAFLRYLLVSEVTEMYMASQQKQWFESTSLFRGANEGSMGESLSRFLASEFLSITGVSPAIDPRHTIAGIWLNADPGRPDRVDSAPDDIMPDAWTSCGVSFLFYLKDQLKKTIQEIVASPAPTLAGVYTNLTGRADGWSSFQSVVNSHYPSDKGRQYHPPLDNVFPVAELTHFMAPPTISWVENYPNILVLVLGHSISVGVDVELTSDDVTLIDLPPSVAINSSAQMTLTVPPQPASFVSKVVNLNATYAGRTLHQSIKVVRPEDLPVTPLEIRVILGEDPCAPCFVEGTPARFEVANPGVLRDRTGLTFTWAVSGAAAPVTNAPTLQIPSLPAAGTQVTVEATVANASGIHSTGYFRFVTAQNLPALAEDVRRLQCELAQIRAIAAFVPPWAPIEKGFVTPTIEQVANIEKQAERLTVAARRLVVSAKAIQSSRGPRDQR